MARRSVSGLGEQRSVAARGGGIDAQVAFERIALGRVVLANQRQDRPGPPGERRPYRRKHAALRAAGDGGDAADGGEGVRGDLPVQHAHAGVGGGGGGLGAKRTGGPCGDDHDGVPRLAGQCALRARRVRAGAEAEHHPARREREPVRFPGRAGQVQRGEAGAGAAPRPCREGAPGVGDGGAERSRVDRGARRQAPGRGGTRREAAHIVGASRLRPGPAQPSPPKGCEPTAAPIWLRLT